jgi:hypothetical protein
MKESNTWFLMGMASMGMLVLLLSGCGESRDKQTFDKTYCGSTDECLDRATKADQWNEARYFVERASVYSRKD